MAAAAVALPAAPVLAGRNDRLLRVARAGDLDAMQMLNKIMLEWVRDHSESIVEAVFQPDPMLAHMRVARGKLHISGGHQVVERFRY